VTGSRKILLISASHYEPRGGVARVERYWTSGLTLVQLEALTPRDFVCELVDDFRREPPLETDAELVGITAMGLQIGRKRCRWRSSTCRSRIPGRRSTTGWRRRGGS